MQRKVYIAGPMRGHPELNFPAFDKAAALGRALGWHVISPAEMDRAHGDTPEAVGPIGWNGGEPAYVRKFIERDYNVIIRELKAENGDAIAVLPGFETSVGARGEVFLGLWAKLKLLDATTFQPIVVTPYFNVTRFPGPAERGIPTDMPAEFQQCYGGQCGIEHDLAVASTIKIAEDFANREVL